jgi:hypothetical protein
LSITFAPASETALKNQQPFASPALESAGDAGLFSGFFQALFDGFF